MTTERRTFLKNAAGLPAAYTLPALGLAHGPAAHRLKHTTDPVVAPVNQALFGGWEGNWLAWNMAQDVALPCAKGPKLGFLMYAVAETADERLDCYSPDAFKYQITAREPTV